MKPTPSMESFLNGLVKKFNEIPDTSKYDKKKTVSEFIIPLFSGLGWEFEGKTPSIIDVSAISKDRADYSFEIEGITKFILKIAPLDENIDDKKWIIPVTTFAFNKGITWAIVTNFKKIKVLNSEVKGKTPLQMQFFEITFDEFISKYDRLAYLLKKSFELDIIDKEAEYFSKKQKKTPIDKQLLEDLLKFSDKLSHDIQKNNSKKLSMEEIDESVHKILNRLIFIRACGDRGLEQKHLIAHLREWEETKDEKLVKHLRKIFDYFEENYGGTIFSDHLCDKLEISDPTLQEIIEGLYISEDKSIQYDFSIIESDVLGQMYEQYLRLLRTEDKQTNLEISFRREHGIFYTPNFVVNYMIKNTLERVIENKKIDKTKIRILDPACGSGSFLIKAYDFLYAHHIKNDKYVQTQISTDIEGGVYSKKVQILKENLFGVDLDKVATEIVQLNLLLKIAEKKHHLPILQQNIQHGNSLIDDEIYDEFYFNWEEQFHQILKNENGFDVVIGNPPYVRQEKISSIKSYLELNFEVFDGHADLYVYFFEKATKLLKDGGYLSFIVSNKWLKSGYGKNLREFLPKYRIEEIIDFGDTQIFKGATTYPCIIILQKIKIPNQKIKICNIESTNYLPFEKYINLNQFDYPQKKLNNKSWMLVNTNIENVIKKIKNGKITLNEYTKDQIYRGITSGGTDVFVIDNTTKERLVREDPKSEIIIKPYLDGKGVQRYNIDDKGKWILFIPWSYDLEFSQPIKKHLEEFKKKLSNRPEVKEGILNWWCMSRYNSQNIEFYSKPKIIYGVFVTKPRFMIDYRGFFTNNGNFCIPIADKRLLGILNSKLGWFLIINYCTRIRGGVQLIKENFGQIPISKKESPELEKYVSEIIQLHEEIKQLQIHMDDKRKNILRKCVELDELIDKEVYKIYDLTVEEIEIIELLLKNTK